MPASKKSAKKSCVLCGKLITGHGNNAEPLASGKCCDQCNMQVIMARMKTLGKKKSPHLGGKTRKKSYKKNKKTKKHRRKYKNKRKKQKGGTGFWITNAAMAALGLTIDPAGQVIHPQGHNPVPKRFVNETHSYLPGETTFALSSLQKEEAEDYSKKLKKYHDDKHALELGISTATFLGDDVLAASYASELADQKQPDLPDFAVPVSYEKLSGGKRRAQKKSKHRRKYKNKKKSRKKRR